ncbi:MAG: MerR family transcriptional regulator [Flavobacteriales bacterium]|nr:MerR family transcriptional regulator [Flavobacteriales bacterium]
MSEDKLIPIEQLCVHYEIETSLFYELHDFNIIEILSVEDSIFIHEDKIGVVEKVVRMQKDLNINLEGIDTVLNLLDKINDLQTELNAVKNRLRLYED